MQKCLCNRTDATIVATLKTFTVCVQTRHPVDSVHMRWYSQHRANTLINKQGQIAMIIINGYHCSQAHLQIPCLTQQMVPVQKLAKVQAVQVILQHQGQKHICRYPLTLTEVQAITRDQMTFIQRCHVLLLLFKIQMNLDQKSHNIN